MLYVYDLPLQTRFRGIDRRSGVLMRGPAGWAEFAPFWNYNDAQSAPWLRAALAHATSGLPAPTGKPIPVNLTVPAVSADEAHDAASAPHGCTTAKVKVADWRMEDGRDAVKEGITQDLARLEAVRGAMGPSAKLRIDVNQAWDLEFAARWLPEYDRAAGGLEYAEQPVPGARKLAELRRRVDVPLAADEALRLADDPLEVVRLDAADVAVLKVHPLGGIEAALKLADQLGLPTVVSSAIDTAVGLRAGLALAAALPGTLACGLGTGGLLVSDVTEPLLPSQGVIVDRGVEPNLDDETWRADAELTKRWLSRITSVAKEAELDLSAVLEAGC